MGHGDQLIEGNFSRCHGDFPLVVERIGANVRSFKSGDRALKQSVLLCQWAAFSHRDTRADRNVLSRSVVCIVTERIGPVARSLVAHEPDGTDHAAE